MRVRLLITVACVASLLAAAAGVPAANSQAPALTTTAADAATTVTTAVASAAAPDPAAPTTTSASATTTPTAGTTTDPGTATTSQSSTSDTTTVPPTDTTDVDPAAPEVVVDFPDTPETAGDSKDDGVIEAVTTDTTPAPAPQPAPASAPTASAAATPVVAGPIVPAPTAAAGSPTASQDPQPAKPASDKPTSSPLPPVQPVAPLTPTPGPVKPPKPAGTEDANTPAALRKLKPYKPAAHVAQVMAITAGSAATIGALAAGLGAAAGGGGGGSRRRNAGTRSGRATVALAGAGGGGKGGSGDGGDGGGWLENVELEREVGLLPGYGWGDRSRTWGWRITPPVDRFSASWPDRLAMVSPVMARVSVDGDYLRAMLGGLYLLLFPIAALLGVLAAGSTGGAALPPTFGLFIAILGLSIFDSMVGYTAGLAFALALLVAGHLDSSAAVRETAGIVLLWFAVPLAASAVRPLRRNLDLRPTGLWDRTADFVLAGLFAGWVASNQISALGPLRGYELPISDKRWTVALIVVALIGIRILVETAATHLYPERLEAVEAQGELEPPRLQEAISLGIQMAVLAFVSASFLSLGWALFLGVAVFFLPLIPWLFIEKVPYSAFVAKWMPGGLAKWAFIIIAGVWLSKLLDHLVTDPEQSIEWGFIVLPLPLLICWGLELFAENEPEEDGDEAEDETEEDEEGRFPLTWKLRLAGVPVLAACVYYVYFVIG